MRMLIMRLKTQVAILKFQNEMIEIIYELFMWFLKNVLMYIKSLRIKKSI